MAVTLKQFLENPRIFNSNAERCNSCNVVLQTAITGREEIEGKQVCSDCYYEQLGEMIERHPVGGLGSHR